MSVTTMPMNLAENSSPKMDEGVVTTINNNIQKGENVETKDDGSMNEEFTDDTTSDTQSTDNIYSESSGALYGSDDIIFDDEISFEEKRERANSVDHLKEKAIEMLQKELNNARKELKVKDEVCKELSDVRVKVESELEDLTASLFEEAHKMVNEANMKQYVAEKRLAAAQGEIDALQTEVSALKSLVLTSTPSSPNPQMHPQLIKKKKDLLVSPIRKPRKNHMNSENKVIKAQLERIPSKPIIKMAKEVDFVIMEQLSNWLKTTSIATPPKETDQSEASNSNDNTMTAVYDEIDTPVTSQLLERIETEDIVPCLTFPCATFSKKVSECVRENSLTIEPLQKPVHEKCGLCGSLIHCKHRIKCGEDDEWVPISQSCRMRIASVCDFLTYIRYIEKGLIRHSKDHIYWELTRLRREMSLAKLGYYKEE